MSTDSSPTPSLESATYPSDRLHVDQWVTWKPTDNGRKAPRAPYAYPNWPERYVDVQDPTHWTDFETAREWCSKLPGFELALVIRDRVRYPDEDLVVIDYDDIRSSDTGAIHPVVQDHLVDASSYADVSPSGAGIHVLCRGQLPPDVTTIADSLPEHEVFPNASIEVYESSRFVAMTGRHIVGTPRETRPAQAFIDDLAGAFATPQSDATTTSSPSEDTQNSWRPPDCETTTDIRDVYRAIERTRPAEIRLKSPVTETRSDGTKSRDPCWTNSESGTRLAELDDGWIYRDGLVVLDALQVVSLEEGLITAAGEYPSGRAFWRAVNTLRDRGATIPDYQSEKESNTAQFTPSPDRSLVSLRSEFAAKTRRLAVLTTEVAALRSDLTQRIRDLRRT